MERVLVALVLAVAIGAFALLLRRRRGVDVPTAAAGLVPAQLDRADFALPGAPWLVAVFTSATCDACTEVRAKAEVLASDDVAVEAIEFPARRDLHQRYGIDAVPLVLIADADGVVRTHFLGPVGSTELWNAVAAVRAGQSVD